MIITNLIMRLKEYMWLLEIVSTAPGDLFGASWSNQDALRCVGRLDRSILRVELATKLILDNFGSIFEASKDHFWGLKRGNNQVEGQGRIFGAFGVDFGPNFGDLLIQDEHVFTIILC